MNEQIPHHIVFHRGFQFECVLCLSYRHIRNVCAAQEEIHERMCLRIQFKKDDTLIKTPGYSSLAHPVRTKYDAYYCIDHHK